MWGAASIPERKQSSLEVSKSGDVGRIRIQGRATDSQFSAPSPEPIQPLTRVAVALCQGRWEGGVGPRLGVSQTVASPQGGVQLSWMVHVVVSSGLCPVARIRGLRDAPFIAHSTAPSKPEITAPPLLGALEVGWNGDPWGLEGVQEEAGYLDTLPSPWRLH